MTSNKRLVVGASWMVSPDIKHSFLLSSSTVFMFSIQIVSTGPSNTSHFLKIKSIDYKYQRAMPIKYLSIHNKMSGIMEPERSSMISRSILTDSILFFNLCLDLRSVNFYNTHFNAHILHASLFLQCMLQ
jgi:hypothetical protein